MILTYFSDTLFLRDFTVKWVVYSMASYYEVKIKEDKRVMTEFYWS